MTELALYKQLKEYMDYQYPNVIKHFDGSGIHNPSKATRGIYSYLNGRGYPDLFIAVPRWRTEPTDDADLLMSAGTTGAYSIRLYSGLYLELKREGERLKKKTGEWASEHIAEQADMLDRLSEQGYLAMFAVGFNEAKDLIDSYLTDEVDDGSIF